MCGEGQSGHYRDHENNPADKPLRVAGIWDIQSHQHERHAERDTANRQTSRDTRRPAGPAVDLARRKDLSDNDRAKMQPRRQRARIKIKTDQDRRGGD
jgi:hypothetical protein